MNASVFLSNTEVTHPRSEALVFSCATIDLRCNVLYSHLQVFITARSACAARLTGMARFYICLKVD